MKQAIQPLGSLEQKIMQRIWQHGQATVRDVYNDLQVDTPLAYTTVMTTMDRLTKKGILRRHKISKAYHYEATTSAASLDQQHSKRIIDSLLQHFGTVAIAQFVAAIDEMDQAKLDDLRQALNAR